MRYLDRDYWEKKEKEKSDLKAKALSDSSLTSETASKITQQTSKQLSTESSNTGISQPFVTRVNIPEIKDNVLGIHDNTTTSLNSIYQVSPQ